MGKRIAALEKKIEENKKYSLEEAAKIVKENANAKFNETVELHIRLGIDPKQSDQAVRSTVLLPAGSGKTKKVAVIVKGEKLKEAKEAGADVCGENDLIEKIQKGWLDFDVLVATPDAMKDVSKLGKILGPKGLMPNPKSGTVTFDIARTVKELKGGRIEFKNDDYGIIHCGIGKASFSQEQISENAKALIQAVLKVKPASSKGVYIRSITLSSSMGPGVPIEPSQKFESAI
ncbi:MAG: 50S ribosomal protein L1 [Elusimicrobia bacterium RIFCSPLOWO2_02_FULL_39_32]|nr:MAG: 50S ribosomal protein L1 [Elusimicrobia bacterium GWA2_38_7]OGR81557.1 MAG: 50S ribosomal protein L1 [Elusimicrobia bacterium RIFCSPHIGHO2_02_FULL_39_36]OGR91601.1 MAG: 50S ribosomal protein L1 [Elusimicrobia bacterium RIFCSPLOWO2_02_FULL_39_32]OGR98828.1 MAG: 50S ribosomal protein L1 [Elusimicrobia bacterium RIFCSPLOWO2_12_FULL_39_28]